MIILFSKDEISHLIIKYKLGLLLLPHKISKFIIGTLLKYILFNILYILYTPFYISFEKNLIFIMIVKCKF